MPPRFTLARSIDPDYPTNRAILLLTLAVLAGGVIVTLLSGAAIPGSIIAAVSGAASFFLAWALGRELDPDEEYAAFVSAGLMAGALLLFPLPDPVTALFAVLLLRTVNRTSGLPTRVLDSVVLLLIAAWPLMQGYLFAGVAMAAAFLLDGLLSRPNRLQPGFALLALLETGFFAASGPGITVDPIVPAAGGALLLGSLLYLAVIGRSQSVTTTGDRTQKRLSPIRVQSAQVLVLSWAFLSAVIGGETAFVAMLPIWAGIVGTGMYRVTVHLTSQ